MSNEMPILEDFEKATERLEEVLKLEKTGVTRDSAIKRFELCFDLAWKSIKFYAQKEALECYSPKESFKIAFQLKLINYEEKWLEMIKDRNLTTHLYKEEEADKAYKKLPGYLEMFKNLLNQIEKSLAE
jgi:nucleotidyltransferase substrate binding protein (TIGR01987 family)